MSVAGLEKFHIFSFHSKGNWYQFHRKVRASTSYIGKTLIGRMLTFVCRKSSTVGYRNNVALYKAVSASKVIWNDSFPTEYYYVLALHNQKAKRIKAWK